MTYSQATNQHKILHKSCLCWMICGKFFGQ